MKKTLALASVLLILISCQNEKGRAQETTDYSALFLVDQVPEKTPLTFMESIVPDSMLIHNGVFSPDLSEFYYSLSDLNYEQFTVKVIRKVGSAWSEPEVAFFNSQHNDHGMAFSPDGQYLYFSSTRPIAPIKGDSVANTWHIWRSKKVNESWSDPKFVDIPNMRDKLVSHPSIANSGKMYFHSSNPDFTEMTLYSSQEIDGKFQDAEKLTFAWFMSSPKTTVFIAPDESYLLFASVQSQLFMTISYPDGNGNWVHSKKLHPSINANGQGNPYVTPDGKFLFYVGNENNINEDLKLRVKWVSMDAVLATKN